MIETTHMVAMRDGTRLSTDLYFPARPRQALPTLLTRTPYDKRNHVGSPPSEWRDMVSHAPGDTWWQRKGHITRRDVLDVPILHVNSWFDFGVQETLVLAQMVRQGGGSERTRHNQFVLVSAAGHCGTDKLLPGARIGELELGDPSVDAFGLYIRWFRHWLEGPGGDFPGLPALRFYLLNRNEWREAAAWPPADARPVDWHLSSQLGAQSLHGDGCLHTSPPGQAGADSFVYDPLNPVPTAGGVMWSPGTPPAVPVGPVDQRAVQVRQDVLVYTSPPFAQALEIVGPVTAQLCVRSSAADTDFTAKLSIVLPDGRALWLTEGILRLRYWAGLDQARPVAPGVVTTLHIDLKSTAFEVAPGSRLRLEVSSSNFPRFERNLNTGGANFDECVSVLATNTVLHGPEHTSCLKLWVRDALPLAPMQ